MVEKIKIGWKEYGIQCVESSNVLMNGGMECYGEILHDKCLIRLNVSNTEDQMRATVVHEILHGIENMYGIDLGEEVVTKLGNALYTLVKDNPKLIGGLISPQ
ncbi:hypothetical protein PBV87_00840 [Niameybacter massiliensis]|uniref:Uncharacterized protein n=1 Tax=Holtiella tumoricola TaxID=3018743 RepID=A0AA42DJD6_9FIRM|nr:hypothetical protein [Holtiella tumoricola]MDA3730059.1 hypothetical protein [Holtiella tumoricola]